MEATLFNSVEVDFRQKVNPLRKLLEMSPEAFSFQYLPFAKLKKNSAGNRNWETCAEDSSLRYKTD